MLHILGEHCRYRAPPNSLYIAELHMRRNINWFGLMGKLLNPDGTLRRILQEEGDEERLPPSQNILTLTSIGGMDFSKDM